MLVIIKIPTLAMQTRFYTLASYRADLEVLTSDVFNYHNYEAHPLC